MALLYKVGASYSLKAASNGSLRELISKAEHLMEKYAIDTDHSLMQALQNVKKSVGLPMDGGRLLDDYSLQYTDSIRPASKPRHEAPSKQKVFVTSSQGNRPTSQPKSFMIKKASRSPQATKRAASPGFIKESVVVRTDKTPTLKITTGKSIGDNSAIARKKPGKSLQEPRSSILEVKESVDEQRHSAFKPTKSIQESTEDTPSAKELRETAAKVRSKFREGMDDLLRMGELVKKEIQEINQAPRRSIIKLKKKAGEVNDTSEDEAPSFLDKEISKKMMLLQQHQKEWEKQKNLFQMKLEKLEKRLELPTAIDDAGLLLVQKTPKTDSDAGHKPEAAKALHNNTFLAPKTRPESITIRPKDKSSHLPMSSSSIHSPATIAKAKLESDSSIRLPESQPNDYLTALKQAMRNLENGIDEFKEEFLQVISYTMDRNVIIGFKVVKDQSAGGKPTVTLTLYTTNTDLLDYSTSIDLVTKHQDNISLDELEFILHNIKATEVIPSHMPVSTFTSIKHFLVRVLGKFVHINENEHNSELDSLIIKKVPRSIVADQALVVKFFDEDHTLTMVHMNEKTFRIVLRPVRESEDADGFCADFVVSDFVFTNFFSVCSRQYLIFQKLFEDGYKPSQQEMDIMKARLETTIRCIWLLPIAEKKVVINNLGQSLLSAEEPGCLPRESSHRARPYSEVNGVQEPSLCSQAG